MMRNRIIFGLLWVLSLVGISFFGGAISYGFFYVLTVIPVVSFLYLLCVFFLFHMYQKIDSNWLVANKSGTFYFTLVNDFFLVFSGIQVKFYSDFSDISGLDEKTEYEFLPHTGITKETNLICKYRGEYEVGIKTVVVQDYFRLFRLTYKNREPLRVTVRPDLIKLEKLDGIDTNNVSSNPGPSDTNPDVLARPYVQGDDLRHVHWKLSAKTGELMVRNRIGEQKQGVGIVMSTERCSSKPTDYLPIEEKILETELALTYYFAERNIPVFNFYINPEPVFSYLSSLEQFEAHYEKMSSVSFDKDNNDDIMLSKAAENLSLLQCKAVFAVIHDWSENLNNFLGVLSKNGVSVVVYLICDTKPEEVDLISAPGVKVICIGRQDDLKEVM